MIYRVVCIAAFVSFSLVAGQVCAAQESKTLNWYELLLDPDTKPSEITAAINGGADVKARNKNGFTPLMLVAAYTDNAEVISALLQAGADIKARINELTPLMLTAMLNSNPDVILVLLQAGADAKVTCDEGKTALDYAKDNAKIKGTPAYRELSNASFD